MEINNLYLVKHAASGSELELECAMDKVKKKPRVISATLVRGNIISLQGVKRALEYYKESRESEDDEPNETA